MTTAIFCDTITIESLKGAETMAENRVGISMMMNKELKEAFEKFCGEVGLSVSSAFTLFAKKCVQTGRIPFTIGKDEETGAAEAAIRGYLALKAFADKHRMTPEEKAAYYTPENMEKVDAELDRRLAMYDAEEADE